MKPGCIYQHANQKGTYIQIINKHQDPDINHKKYTVKWFIYDSEIKKLIDMNIVQEMVIPNDDLKYYIMVSI